MVDPSTFRTGAAGYLLRNVVVVDENGVGVAGFWQYGTISFGEFYRWMNQLVFTSDEWALFDAVDRTDPNLLNRLKLADSAIVSPGVYLILKTDGRPLRFGLEHSSGRLRIPTLSNTPTREDHYRLRTRTRDRKCLITGQVATSWKGFQAAHIFPRAHSIDWTEKGFSSLITDTAPLNQIGGPLKIDSVQNVIMMRSDLHEKWDNYEFAVNPDDNYRITAFISGLEDLDGLHLQMDHILDPTLRPVDDFFQDHFLQALLRHVKGGADVLPDYYDDLAQGDNCLSDSEKWGQGIGKAQLELLLQDRLFGRSLQDGVGVS